MKKRNTAIRALSVFLAYAMVCTSVPAAGQEMFGSGVNRETEENTSDLKEFQSSQADEFGIDTGSDAELFGSDDAKQEFQDGENSEEGTDGIRYIKGRPLTEEERKEELEPFKNLKPLDPGIEVESDLTSVYAAYGNREAAFPSSYDARKEGLVTPVKNQNPFGTCWAFGMAAIMETSLLAQNKGPYDLSEEHLSYFFSNRQNDPLGNTPDDKNYVLGNYHVIGGNDHLAAIYLSTWSGMTTEADVPFPTDSSHQNDLTVQIPESKAYNSAAYLKNASVSKYSEERMKEMLLNDHAVSIMLYMKESYVNPDTAAYCYPVGKSNSTVINHIVTVVGWDDTYSKDNFLPVSNVTSDGAWIIKNSWGEKKGDGGYYYLSYQDPNISKLVSAEAVAASDQKYRNNYFYDGSSALSVIPIQAGQSVAAVYETTAGKGKAEVLGEVNLVTNSDNACYKLQQELIEIDTTNILFIVGGAFEGLEKVIKARTNKKVIGFGAEISKEKEERVGEVFAKVLPEDLVKQGIIPELVGRLPIITTLQDLDEEALIKILTEPKNAIVKQYKKLFDLEGVDLEFTPEALKKIASLALERRIGARGLRAIIEQTMLELMYEVPSDESIHKVTIGEDAVLDSSKAIIEKE